MALNPLYTFDEIPTTSAAAMREFVDTFLAILGASQPTGWADQMGALVSTAAPMLTFPVSQISTQYRRTQGNQGQAKSFGEKSFNVKAEEFDDGFEAPLMSLSQYGYAQRWAQGPQRLADAEVQFRHTQVAALLEAGASTANYDGVNFFSTSHPANLFDASMGTWSNYQSSTKSVLSVSNLETEATAMATSVLDENGRKLGPRATDILVSVAKEEPLKNMLAQAMILDSTGAAGVSNPYQGRFNVIGVPEFADTDDWYLVDRNLLAKGFNPWVIMRQNVPAALALREFGEDSHHFKTTGNLRIESHIWYGFALAMPHAIRLVKGA